MAKDKDPALAHAFFDLLFPLMLPDLDKNDTHYTFTRDIVMKELELIQSGTLLEQAIAKQKGIKRTDTQCMDFPDGSDAKSACVRWTNKGKTYGAPVSSIYNKIGLLRTVVYERQNHEFYYFLIPHEAYKNIPKTSNIEIPFNLDGSPRRNPKVRNINWWQFEVPDFQGILSDTPADVEFKKQPE